MSQVHFVVPDGVDDPRRPSGGNVYDRRLADELTNQGWDVREHSVPGRWPAPEPADSDRLDGLLAGLPDESLVLIDGLIASAAEQLVTVAGRLRVAVLLHMPDATERVEADVLNAAAGVITTSQWSRRRVIARHGVPADRVWTATPGADRAAPALGSPSGRNLVCVGPVTPAKGHGVLIAALAQVADLDCACTCAGRLDLDPTFVAELAQAADSAGIGDRLVMTGPLPRSALDELLARTDLLIAPSLRESYGMAVTEALAAGIPVIATDVGGHREAVGQSPDGTLPGQLIPADDPSGLADALRSWLTDADVRSRWRRASRMRSRDLAGWPETARTVAAILEQIRAKPGPTAARF